MSTRGAIGFRLKNKDYLTYNHSDSYPDWLGVKILEEVSSIENWNSVKNHVSFIAFVDEDKTPSYRELDMYAKYTSSDRSDRKGLKWYDVLRECQGTLLPWMTGKVKHMCDAIDFIKDSLFCEWAYVIDLDEMQFEVWRGFQHEPDPNNRYGQEVHTTVLDNTYYPCKLLVSFPLDKLPTEKDFLQWIEERAPKED